MKLTVHLGARSYDVIIKAGCLHNAGQLVNLGRRVLVVTDDLVPAAYADTILAQCKEGHRLVLPHGEATKSLKGYEQILHALLANGFTRHDAVVAVGGGVMGDLAGFAAATYMRGIDFINCPTTTLSQIDSSVGGKVAINFENTKNIVGAFYQPKCVLVDTSTLATLPPRQVTNGLCEAVKMGLICDAELFAIFEQDDYAQHIEEIIWRSLNAKRLVVEQDETEQGNRAILNFGHTLGHAVESLHLDELYHGECVALGMLPMLKNAKLKKRVLAVYKRMGLAAKITDDPEALYAVMLHDKKAGADTITVVQVEKAGSAKLEKISYDALHTLVKESVQ